MSYKNIKFLLISVFLVILQVSSINSMIVDVLKDAPTGDSCLPYFEQNSTQITSDQIDEVLRRLGRISNTTLRPRIAKLRAALVKSKAAAAASVSTVAVEKVESELKAVEEEKEKLKQAQEITKKRVEAAEAEAQKLRSDIAAKEQELATARLSAASSSGITDMTAEQQELWASTFDDTFSKSGESDRTKKSLEAKTAADKAVQGARTLAAAEAEKKRQEEEQKRKEAELKKKEEDFVSFLTQSDIQRRVEEFDNDFLQKCEEPVHKLEGFIKFCTDVLAWDETKLRDYVQRQDAASKKELLVYMKTLNTDALNVKDPQVGDDNDLDLTKEQDDKFLELKHLFENFSTCKSETDIERKLEEDTTIGNKIKSLIQILYCGANARNYAELRSNETIVKKFTTKTGGASTVLSFVLTKISQHDEKFRKAVASLLLVAREAVEKNTDAFLNINPFWAVYVRFDNAQLEKNYFYFYKIFNKIFDFTFSSFLTQFGADINRFKQQFTGEIVAKYSALTGIKNFELEKRAKKIFTAKVFAIKEQYDGLVNAYRSSIGKLSKGHFFMDATALTFYLLMKHQIDSDVLQSFFVFLVYLEKTIDTQNFSAYDRWYQTQYTSLVEKYTELFRSTPAFSDEDILVRFLQNFVMAKRSSDYHSPSIDDAKKLFPAIKVDEIANVGAYKKRLESSFYVHCLDSRFTLHLFLYAHKYYSKVNFISKLNGIKDLNDLYDFVISVLEVFSFSADAKDTLLEHVFNYSQNKSILEKNNLVRFLEVFVNDFIKKYVGPPGSIRQFIIELLQYLDKKNAPKESKVEVLKKFGFFGCFLSKQGSQYIFAFKSKEKDINEKIAYVFSPILLLLKAFKDDPSFFQKIYTNEKRSDLSGLDGEYVVFKDLVKEEKKDGTDVVAFTIDPLWLFDLIMYIFMESNPICLFTQSDLAVVDYYLNKDGVVSDEIFEELANTRRIVSAVIGTSPPPPMPPPPGMLGMPPPPPMPPPPGMLGMPPPPPMLGGMPPPPGMGMVLGSPPKISTLNEWLYAQKYCEYVGRYREYIRRLPCAMLQNVPLAAANVAASYRRSVINGFFGKETKPDKVRRLTDTLMSFDFVDYERSKDDPVINAVLDKLFSRKGYPPFIHTLFTKKAGDVADIITQLKSVDLTNALQSDSRLSLSIKFWLDNNPDIRSAIEGQLDHPLVYSNGLKLSANKGKVVMVKSKTTSSSQVEVKSPEEVQQAFARRVANKNIESDSDVESLAKLSQVEWSSGTMSNLLNYLKARQERIANGASLPKIKTTLNSIHGVDLKEELPRYSEMFMTRDELASMKPDEERVQALNPVTNTVAARKIETESPYDLSFSRLLSAISTHDIKNVVTFLCNLTAVGWENADVYRTKDDADTVLHRMFDMLAGYEMLSTTHGIDALIEKIAQSDKSAVLIQLFKVKNTRRNTPIKEFIIKNKDVHFKKTFEIAIKLQQALLAKELDVLEEISALFDRHTFALMRHDVRLLMEAVKRLVVDDSLKILPLFLATMPDGKLRHIDVFIETWSTEEIKQFNTALEEHLKSKVESVVLELRMKAWNDFLQLEILKAAQNHARVLWENLSYLGGALTVSSGPMQTLQGVVMPFLQRKADDLTARLKSPVVAATSS